MTDSRNPQKDPLRVALLAMNGPFARAALQRLLARGRVPAALVLPHPRGRAARSRLLDLAALWPSGGVDAAAGASLAALAAQVHIPVYEIGAPDTPDALAVLEGLAPDLLFVTCFPYLLPVAWWAFPRLGCLNLHPSLLPAYRGPTPVFWQLRQGEPHTGVTLHQVDVGMDSGPIVAQQRVAYPDGASGEQLDDLLGAVGGELAAAAWGQAADGAPLAGSPQQAAAATSFSFPTAADRVVTTDWPARRAFNFLAGAGAWAPLEVQAGPQILLVQGAVQHQPGRELPAPVVQAGGQVWVQFAGGAVQVQLYRGIC